MREGRMIMPVSVGAYHSFVDGQCIGKFVEELRKFRTNIKIYE